MPNVPNNEIQSAGIRSGLDRNDGTNGFGTASTAGLIVINYASGGTTINSIKVEEMPDSPTIERAEQCTVTHRYLTSYRNALNLVAIYGRGALVVDSGANYYRVLSSSVQFGYAGTKTMFTVICESISFDVPPDEFTINPVKLNLDIMKHPRYFYALMPTNQIPNYTGPQDTNSQINAKQAIIRAIQAYRENPSIPTSANLNGMISLLHDNVLCGVVSGNFVVAKPNPAFNPNAVATGPDAIGATPSANPAQIYVAVQQSVSDPNSKIAFAMYAAQEIIGKLWRMEDSPLVNGVEITHTDYWFRPPLLDLGGYIQDPVAAGLPDYFYSTAYPPNPAFTIFDGLSQFNPQCYSRTGLYNGGTSISWLRDADTFEYQRTWFRRTRKWLGAPLGSWDTDLYQTGNRPQLNTFTNNPPAGYRNLILS